MTKRLNLWYTNIDGINFSCIVKIYLYIMLGEITMKEKLSKRELIYIASMLFGLFFGAGNLIFPIYMGQLAGENMWRAVIGFLIT